MESSIAFTRQIIADNVRATTFRRWREDHDPAGLGLRRALHTQTGLERIQVPGGKHEQGSQCGSGGNCKLPDRLLHDRAALAGPGRKDQCRPDRDFTPADNRKQPNAGGVAGRDSCAAICCARIGARAMGTLEEIASLVHAPRPGKPRRFSVCGTALPSALNWLRDKNRKAPARMRARAFACDECFSLNGVDLLGHRLVQPGGALDGGNHILVAASGWSDRG
jgi:hypothetical protein